MIGTVSIAGTTVPAEEISAAGFAPYGALVDPMDLSKTSSANYGTAVKSHFVLPVTNNYAQAPSGAAATANWHIFRSSPPAGVSPGRCNFLVKVLERHPFLTQTFLPLGRGIGMAYLVIVAATGSDGLPDPASIKAFVVPGNVGVTYGVATWHAPMVAISKTDFAVLVHENGVADEDCQECGVSGVSVVYKRDSRL